MGFFKSDSRPSYKTASVAWNPSVLIAGLDEYEVESIYFKYTICCQFWYPILSLDLSGRNLGIQYSTQDNQFATFGPDFYRILFKLPCCILSVSLLSLSTRMTSVRIPFSIQPFRCTVITSSLTQNTNHVDFFVWQIISHNYKIIKKFHKNAQNMTFAKKISMLFNVRMSCQE